jgi:hypothetical protein
MGQALSSREWTFSMELPLQWGETGQKRKIHIGSAHCGNIALHLAAIAMGARLLTTRTRMEAWRKRVPLAPI